MSADYKEKFFQWGGGYEKVAAPQKIFPGSALDTVDFFLKFLDVKVLLLILDPVRKVKKLITSGKS